MSNLIVTIISIALAALALLVGAYYAGAAFENAQIDEIANAIMNEANQILVAERLWSVNNGQPDVSGMPNGSIVGAGITYLDPNGTSGAMGLLVAGKELAEWPSIGGPLAPPSPNTGNILTSSGDLDACYSLADAKGPLYRFLFAYKNGNYVQYSFHINDPYNGNCTTTSGTLNGLFSSSTTDTSEAKHPIVLIAKAINKRLNQISSSADTSTVPYVGLPQSPTGGNGYGTIILDTNGSIQTNYCYILSGATMWLACTFGPS